MKKKWKTQEPITSNQSNKNNLDENLKLESNGKREIIKSRSERKKVKEKRKILQIGLVEFSRSRVEG